MRVRVKLGDSLVGQSAKQNRGVHALHFRFKPASAKLHAPASHVRVDANAAVTVTTPNHPSATAKQGANTVFRGNAERLDGDFVLYEACDGSWVLERIHSHYRDLAPDRDALAVHTAPPAVAPPTLALVPPPSAALITDAAISVNDLFGENSADGIELSSGENRGADSDSDSELSDSV